MEETDVSGVCTTTYKTLSHEDSLMIEKTKDTTHCSHKPTSPLDLLTPATYSTNSLLQNTVLLKSFQRCEQKITDGVLQESTCSETFVFRPFSSSTNGASTVSETRLTLKSVTRGAVAIPGKKKKSFFYKNDKSFQIS